MPTIYIDNDVFSELQKHALPLVDNSNSVLRRLLGLDEQSIPKHSNVLEIPVKDYAIKYGLIPVAHSNRRFFPGYRVPFSLVTDAETFTVKVSSGNKDTPEGDPDGGDYITGGLKKLYRASPAVKNGDIFRVEVLELGKRYKLSVLRK